MTRRGHLVSDSKEHQRLYVERWGEESAFLANGGNVLHVEDEARHREVLASHGATQASGVPS
jgi:hypothetical protein